MVCRPRASWFVLCAWDSKFRSHPRSKGSEVRGRRRRLGRRDFIAEPVGGIQMNGREKGRRTTWEDETDRKLPEDTKVPYPSFL